MSTPLDHLRERLARKAAARRQPRGDAPGVGPASGADASAPTGSSEQDVPGRRGAGEPITLAASEPVGPRVVRRIVWGYEVGVLPVPWLMGSKRLKAALERAGFAIRVDLLPLTGLPPDTDLLFVPDALADAARRAAPDAHVVCVDERPGPEVFQTLVDQLRAGVDLTVASDEAADAAEDAAPPAEPALGSDQPRPPPAPPRGKVVRYRGWERID
jgi:hypothetical protein